MMITVYDRNYDDYRILYDINIDTDNTNTKLDK